MKFSQTALLVFSALGIDFAAYYVYVNHFDLAGNADFSSCGQFGSVNYTNCVTAVLVQQEKDILAAHNWMQFSWVAIGIIFFCCLFALFIPQFERVQKAVAFPRSRLVWAGLAILALFFIGWFTLQSAIFYITLILAYFCFSLFIILLASKTPAQEEPNQASQVDRQSTSRAEEEYTEALQAAQDNPQSVEALTNLGHIQHKLGRDDEALISANKALELNKKYARAWMVRGAALSTMDDQEDKALEALERALIEEPNNVDALYYKGSVFAFQENDNAAHAIFDRVLALNPRHEEALASKGTAYIFTEEYDEALAIAQRLIFFYPDDAVGWRIQGMAYSFQGQEKGIELEKAYDLLNKALASFNRAIEIDPHDSYTYLLKADPLLVMGDNSRALEALNQGLKINPNDRQLQEAKAEIIRRRTKKIASKVAGTAGKLALGLGIGLVEGHARVAKSVWDDIHKS